MISGKVLVTGATGLIGTALCRRLIDSGCSVIAYVRNAQKAHRKLSDEVEVLVGELNKPIVYVGDVDYIVHAASNTSSKAFIENPVEMIGETYHGIQNVLSFARSKMVKKVVFLSTMEVYGLTDSENVTETGYAALDSMVPRNCYPEAKRIAECLAASFVKEYNLPVVVARLTQTFGAGVDPKDNRVFAQFARAAIDGRDVVLKSNGNTARCYLAVEDAVAAIITLLEKGVPGEAYNVANPDSFCSIRDMAEMVVSTFSNGRSKVVVDMQNASECGYLPQFRMKLNVDKLRILGWSPTIGLREMFKGMIHDMRGNV